MEGRGGVRDTLYRLAAETGGRATVNTNDLTGGVRDAIRDASAYYLLGYTPTRDVADGRFHKIKVGVTRKGIDVLARRGYWATRADEAEAATRAANEPAVPGVSEALSSLAVSKTPRAVDVWMGSLFESGHRELLVTWDARERTTDPRAAVRVDVEVLDTADNDAVRSTHSLVATTDPGGQAQARIPVQEVAGRLRFTARDARGDVIDRWTERIDEPTPAQGTLDDIRIYKASSPLALKALRAAASPVPSASRAFRRTDRVLADVAAQDDEGTRLEVELLNARGDVLSSFPLTLVRGATRVATRFEIPVGNLALGRYLLRARAHDGDRTSEVLTAFDIVR